MTPPVPPSYRGPSDAANKPGIYRQMLVDPRAVPVAELRGIKRSAAVVARNLYWGRTFGWANLLEEHDLNLVRRIPRDFGKWRWRRSHTVTPGSAAPVFLVGAQRSGTNMITYGLSYSPEFQIYNEGDRRAFSNYRLRSLDHVADLVAKSRHPYVLFKPLNDTHRALDMLDQLDSVVKPRVLWVYRGVAARIKSALAKFGDSNLRVLRRYLDDETYRHWQLGGSAGLSDASRAAIQKYDISSLTPADGSALFWLIRNRLFFELGLDKRSDVMLVSYESFVADPGATMRGVCEFLGLVFEPGYVEHVGARPSEHTGPRITEDLWRHCEELELRLDEVISQQRAHSG